jgi:hypothetical protein
MAPRHYAPGEIERLPHGAFALEAQQPGHKQSAQRAPAEQSPPLLQRYVGADDTPLLRVCQRGAAVEHDLPALHAASGSQAKHGMRRQLGEEFA